MLNAHLKAPTTLPSPAPARAASRRRRHRFVARGAQFHPRDVRILRLPVHALVQRRAQERLLARRPRDFDARPRRPRVRVQAAARGRPPRAPVASGSAYRAAPWGALDTADSGPGNAAISRHGRG